MRVALARLYSDFGSFRFLVPTALSIAKLCHCTSSSFSGSLPSRHVQISDVATPLVVGLLLISASYILLPSSNPASFVLVYLLILFLTFFLRLLFLTVILL